MNQAKPAQPPKPARPGWIAKSMLGVLLMAVIFASAGLFLCGWFFIQSLLQGTAPALQAVQHVFAVQQTFLQSTLDWHTALLTKLLQWQMQGIDTLNRWAEQLPALANFILLLATTGAVILSRLTIFILSLPLFALLAVVFFTDGLVKRDIRKFQGARESTFVFHRSKRLVKLALFVPLAVYAAWPWAVSPLWLLLPQALVVALLVQWSVQHFKKYV